VTFSIAFLPNQGVSLHGGLYGRLQLGDDSEQFLASVELWHAADYERQWVEALLRICSSHDVSALITSIRDPRASSGVAWWPLYRFGNRIYVQNAMTFFKHMDAPFDFADPYRSVPPRITQNEEGELISEWVISLDDARHFLSKVS